MADILPSVNELDIFTTIRAFILTLVGCEVIRGQVNRVAMPVGDFIALTPISQVPLEKIGRASCRERVSDYV